MTVLGSSFATEQGETIALSIRSLDPVDTGLEDIGLATPVIVDVSVGVVALRILGPPPENISEEDVTDSGILKEPLKRNPRKFGTSPRKRD
jgi:hypothetical protein